MNRTFRLNKLKTRTAVNAKLLVFVIFLVVICNYMYLLLYNLMYLLLYNLHVCTLKLFL